MPFFNIEITLAVFHSMGIKQFFQHIFKQWRIQNLINIPPYFNSSALIPFSPVTFLHFFTFNADYFISNYFISNYFISIIFSIIIFFPFHHTTNCYSVVSIGFLLLIFAISFLIFSICFISLNTVFCLPWIVFNINNKSFSRFTKTYFYLEFS